MNKKRFFFVLIIPALFFAMVLIVWQSGEKSTLIVEQSTVGTHHTLAIRTDGSLWAWGWNHYGQLGLGDLRERYSPVQVGTDTDWDFAAVGGYHTLAIKTDGSLWAWGLGLEGNLGSGHTRNRNSPTMITVKY